MPYPRHCRMDCTYFVPAVCRHSAITRKIQPCQLLVHRPATSWFLVTCRQARIRSCVSEDRPRSRRTTLNESIISCRSVLFIRHVRLIVATPRLTVATPTPMIETISVVILAAPFCRDGRNRACTIGDQDFHALAVTQRNIHGVRTISKEREYIMSRHHANLTIVTQHSNI